MLQSFIRTTDRLNISTKRWQESTEELRTTWDAIMGDLGLSVKQQFSTTIGIINTELEMLDTGPIRELVRVSARFAEVAAIIAPTLSLPFFSSYAGSRLPRGFRTPLGSDAATNLGIGGVIGSVGNTISDLVGIADRITNIQDFQPVIGDVLEIQRRVQESAMREDENAEARQKAIERNTESSAMSLRQLVQMQQQSTPGSRTRALLEGAAGAGLTR